jgi:hypothetical protein
MECIPHPQNECLLLDHQLPWFEEIRRTRGLVQAPKQKIGKIVDFGIPPGFDLLREDLQSLQERPLAPKLDA